MLGVAFPFIYIYIDVVFHRSKDKEDAEMMARMAARGTKIIVNLKMEAQNLPPVISRNTVAEIKGSVYPEQVSAFQNLKSCLPFSFRLGQLAPIQHCLVFLPVLRPTRDYFF